MKYSTLSRLDKIIISLQWLDIVFVLLTLTTGSDVAPYGVLFSTPATLGFLAYLLVRHLHFRRASITSPKLLFWTMLASVLWNCALVSLLIYEIDHMYDNLMW